MKAITSANTDTGASIKLIIIISIIQFLEIKCVIIAIQNSIIGSQVT